MFLVIRNTWREGRTPVEPPTESRLVAGCPDEDEAAALALADTAEFEMRGLDPDSGFWWACAPGALHQWYITAATLH